MKQRIGCTQRILCAVVGVVLCGALLPALGVAFA